MRKVEDLKIYSAIRSYAKKRTARLSMPGHKGEHPLYKKFSKLDFTEIDGLDIFSAVESAEKDLGNILGASLCKILSSGATSGILAMIGAVKDFGDKIIIHRSSHKSVYSALKLFNLEPIILGKASVNGFSKRPSTSEIEGALKNNPTAIGVVLNGVDYFGDAIDLKEISKITKKYGKLLLVDNAHGAHLFLKDYYAGKYADVWVDSAHKVLPTINQGAVICAKNELGGAVNSALNLILTTSPCYPILASVEYGVKFLNSNSDLFIKTEEKVKNLALKLNKKGVKTKIFKDGLKLNVMLKESGIDKDHLEAYLKDKKIDAELVSSFVALFMFSPFSKKSDYSRLLKALIGIEKKELTVKEPAEIETERKAPYLQSNYKEGEYVELERAIGEISGVDAGLFPPCMPIITAGEVINEEVAKVLKEKNVFGLKDGKIKIIR